MGSTSGARPRRRAVRWHALLLLSAGSISGQGSVSCSSGSPPTCETFCENFVSKCAGSEDAMAAGDTCMQDCTAAVSAVPAACSSQRDAVLACGSDASVLDCTNPQNSAACVGATSALATCTTGVGRGTGGSSGSGSGTGAGSSSGSGPAIDGG